MTQLSARHLPVRTPRNRVALLAAASLVVMPLTGCVVVGASSRGGFFIWPGGLGLLVVLLVLFLLLRRR